MEIKNTENNNLKQMQITAVIVSVVLAVILIVSIVLNAGKENKGEALNTQETEIVTDVTALKVTLSQRYAFTNDIGKLTDMSCFLEQVTEDSEYTAKLIRFEKHGVLDVMNDLALSNLTEGSDCFVTAEDALKVGAAEIPVEEGIYRSVLEIADVYGNATYEEVFVILDTTPATINDVDDVVVSVPKEKLSEKPEIDFSVCKGVDEVDGFLSSDKLGFEVNVRDEEKHEWTVTVFHTDRAGNVSSNEFLVTVKEQTSSHGGEVADNKTNYEANQKPVENSDSETMKDKAESNVQNLLNESSKYDPKDANRDGDVSAEEQAKYITPEKQACIDAGYGVVCEFYGGNEFEGVWYAVLMKSSSHTIEGKDGGDILLEYLHERDLDGHISGCYINMDNEWYWYMADDIHEWINEDDEEFWVW